ncbi:MAG: PDZ domain-containing protein [Myxococcales bacterium]|nr:PDZ domain-containing protein [Myxococcales bacterium]
MHLRSLSIALACCVLAWGGYELSHLRARQGGGAIPEVLAAAGGEGAQLLADASGGVGGRGYRISSLNVFSNVALHVKDNYVDPERIDPKEMLVAALNEVERQVAEVMVEDIGGGRLRIRVMDEEKEITIDDVESLWEINLKLRDVFRFFEKNLPEQDDLRSIEYAAVNGALSTLDPHSVLLKPEAFQEMKTSTKGEFGGLGIVISVKDGKLTIISPLDDTPASRAGLKAGDIISRIGEVSTVSMAVEEAVRLLRGPEGSKVTIWVDRKAWTEARKFVIVRERIKLESVESDLLSDNVGYIKIKNFQQNTGKDLEDQLAALTKKAGGKLNGVVLDLRNNPGGLLEQAIRVSDKFLTSGDIVTTVGYGNKLREPKRARWQGTESTLPVAVLVNKGSASASEIVAGALKNLDRAVIIGERSFGKGSVQVLYDFADNSALKLTIAQYLTPGGISIQNEGVTPDVALSPAWLQDKSVRLFYRPQGHREKNLDKHLDRAGQDYVADKPAFELTYLMERDEDAADEEVDEEVGGDGDPDDGAKVKEDYEMRLARELLLSAGAPSRSKILQRGRGFFEAKRAEEEKRISARITELGVDWRPLSDGAEKVGLRAEATLTLEGAPDNVVEAGHDVKLVATVKNTSGVPLYRLRGVLESEHPAFKGREFLFGYLEPGASRSWTVTTRIPRDAASRSDLVTLALTSERGNLADRPQVPVMTRYVPHPQFAYNFLFDDAERGDGDGRLEVGEGVEFLVLVTNAGPGDAEDVSLRLKSAAEEDLFLERGRATVGAIKAGETKAGKLRFRVPKAQSGRATLPLELTIYDSGTGEWLEDEIHLTPDTGTVDKPRALKRGGVVLKSDAVLRSGAGDETTAVGQVAKGTRLEAINQLNGFVEVKIGDDLPVWVQADATGSASKPKTPGKVAFTPLRRPPTITLSQNPGGAVVDGDTAVLAGEVNGRALKDMYVLLNDDKVFFKSGPKADVAAAPAAPAAPGAEASKPAWSAPDEAAVKLPFTVNLPLEEGLNKVLVVARLDEHVVTYRSLYVSRRTQPPAVAEATTRDAK